MKRVSIYDYYYYYSRLPLIRISQVIRNSGYYKQISRAETNIRNVANEPFYKRTIFEYSFILMTKQALNQIRGGK